MSSEDASFEQNPLRELLSLLEKSLPLPVTAAPTAQQQQLEKQQQSLRDQRRSSQSAKPVPDSPWPLASPRASAHDQQEAELWHLFCQSHRNERRFGASNHGANKLLDLLLARRVKSDLWMSSAQPDTLLGLLGALRILLRDRFMQRRCLDDVEALECLARALKLASESYLIHGDTPHMLDIVRELCNVFQKLITCSVASGSGNSGNSANSGKDIFLKLQVHVSLVHLLSANDSATLQCSLHALASLAQQESPRQLLRSSSSGVGGVKPESLTEQLLAIAERYDSQSKRLAANLLRLLLSDASIRSAVSELDGIALLVNLAGSEDVKLAWNALWCLIQLAEDAGVRCEVRALGGVPLILALLVPNEDDSEDGVSEDQAQLTLNVRSAACCALTELLIDDRNSFLIAQNNGVYLLGRLLLPASSIASSNSSSSSAASEGSQRIAEAVNTLRKNSCRALRFLFSLERNRRAVKKLLPTGLLAAFIDIGHYNRDLSAYASVVAAIDRDEELAQELRTNLESVNQNREANQHIKDYAVLEILGSGAFGTVYKVRKQDTMYAIKELNTGGLGRNANERQKNVGYIVSELTMAKEHLRHPNVVRYYKTFEENDKLYIVMELIEGASLMEFFVSMREKGLKFEEDRVWFIFVQIVLALRYLHKEKDIVHRDLSPNNIMLGEDDHVTITDFGLAKQKRKDCSKMISVVGTMVYACPEIVQSQPYGEKADIWSIGCVLYHMAALKAPFDSSNMLNLATRIVEGSYDPTPLQNHFSKQLLDVVAACLTVDSERRPDIVGVASLMAARRRRRGRRWRCGGSGHLPPRPRAGGTSTSSTMAPAAGAATGSASSGVFCFRWGGGGRMPAKQQRRPRQLLSLLRANGAVVRFGLRFQRRPICRRGRAPEPRRCWHRCIGCCIGAATSSLASSASGGGGGGSRPSGLGEQRRPLLDDQPAPGSRCTDFRSPPDPILPMLAALHKLAHLARLPPGVVGGSGSGLGDSRRRLLDKYCGALFSAGVSPVEVKEEIRRLMGASRDPVELELLGASDRLVRQALQEQQRAALRLERLPSATAEDCGAELTYADLAQMLESVLESTEFYHGRAGNRNSQQQQQQHQGGRPALRRGISLSDS
uniref:Protein kinase domain-containing protein n=1 Tax=Macrostomum lignano TaxID=282301 RepID=A0A1I8J9C8_9PLAT